MRSATGTKSAVPAVVTRDTNDVSAFFDGPSFHDGRTGAAAAADALLEPGAVGAGLEHAIPRHNAVVTMVETNRIVIAGPR